MYMIYEYGRKKLIHSSRYVMRVLNDGWLAVLWRNQGCKFEVGVGTSKKRRLIANAEGKSTFLNLQ